jgi:hypothetical protein
VRLKSGAAFRLLSDDEAACTGDDGEQLVSSVLARAITASILNEACGVMTERLLSFCSFE